MDVILYSRVSQEEQAQGEAVSLEQQSKDMRALCERQGWSIVAELVDASNYQATKFPNKGKIVNPSGERDDRPQFLAMLEHIKTGSIDGVICWRDDRLVRHPRVALALEDALDMGDMRRNGRGKAQLYDATGATIDRFTLSIKATIWREENKRRTQRTEMGKVGTLQKGRWPGNYKRLGYVSIKEPDRRGCLITLGDEEEVQTVKNIFNWYESGYSVQEIRELLIKRGVSQKGYMPRKYDWDLPIITQLLHAEEYTGKATWHFSNGLALSIEIPAIISVRQYKRVQEMIKKNVRIATRNARGIYLLQGLAYCGECEGKISPQAIKYYYRRLRDGTAKRYEWEASKYKYRCTKGVKIALRDSHPRPINWDGDALDWAVWRKIVDDAIKRPQFVVNQIVKKMNELQEQGEDVDGDIARARLRLADIMEERATYQRAFGRKKMSEKEFDARMDETLEALQYYEAELSRLIETRDEVDKIAAGVAYIRELLAAIQEKLPEIDIPPDELKRLPQDEQTKIMQARQDILRALVDRVWIYADGLIVVEGVIQGSELQQFGIDNGWNK